VKSEEPCTVEEDEEHIMHKRSLIAESSTLTPRESSSFEEIHPDDE